MILESTPGVRDLPRFVKGIASPLIPVVMRDVEPTRRYNVPAAKALKGAVGVSVIALGGIHGLADIEATILEDGIDLVSMSRPLIMEPNLVNKFKDGKATEARCISCNYCLAGIYSGPLRCYHGKVC